MKIDQKWVGEIAGWKALKAGRALWSAGRVVQASRQENVFRGEIPGAGAPKRVTVRVNGRFDVDSHCQCLESKRTGAMCPHAVAVVLEILDPKRQPKKSERKQEERAQVGAVMFHLEFPPHFPEKLEKGLPVKLSEHETTETTVADIMLWRWVMANMNGKWSPVLGLNASQSVEFLQTLDGHTRITAAGESVVLKMVGNRVPMQVAVDDDRLCLRLESALFEEGRVWYDRELLWMWNASERVLATLRDKHGLLKPEQWKRLCSEQALYLPIARVVSHIELWEQLVLWSNKAFLDELALHPATPEFILTIEGTTEELSACLEVKYQPDILVHAGDELENQDAFPLKQADGSWCVRNLEVEEIAIARLRRAGFEKESRREWGLSGADAVLEFLSSQFVQMQQDWEVRSGQRLNSARSNMVRLVPDIQIQGSGEDWLAFDYGFRTEEGKKVTKDQIKRMLDAGRTSASLKNGKKIVMSSFDAEIMSATLKDCDPRQESGQYYVSKAQGAYIKRLQSYYSQTEEHLESEEGPLSELSSSLQSTLRPYQREGVNWIYQRLEGEGAALLADDMGLGKTLQSLCLLSLWRKKNSKTSLIVCPTSLLDNWKAEAQRFTPDLKLVVLHGSERKALFSEIESHDIVMTSYALVARDLDVYQAVAFGCVIIDEASLIRNPDTQAAKALRSLDAEAKLALTGTPVENAVRDLWSIYAFLLPGYLGSREDFKQHYEAATTGSAPDWNTLKRLRMRTEPFMLRRTKAIVAKDLPPKMEQIVWCEPSQRQQEVYQEIHRAGVAQVDELRDQGQKGHMQMLTVLLRLRQACCHLALLGDDFEQEPLEESSTKLLRLLEIIEEGIRGGHRILIFSQFTKMLAKIRQQLESKDIGYCYLDGTTKSRGAEVDKFQDPSGPPVFLISLKAGGYGLNLTAADIVVHFDPWWNPAVEAQATDRAHRIGQTRPITVYKFITKGSVEEKILRLQEKKRTLIGGAISDEAQPMMKGLDANEIASLLG